MADKYYAVRVGLRPGIYRSWKECEAVVKGYPGAQFKSFLSEEEAQSYMDNGAKRYDGNLDIPYAFVDGSYNKDTGVYGYGGFLVYEKDGKQERIPVQGNGDNAAFASSRNVAGEVHGCMAAVQKASELGLKKLTVYYDYTGIEYWATREWKTNCELTALYAAFMAKHMADMDIRFVKVAAHTGIEGNEEADRMAKQSVGLDK